MVKIISLLMIISISVMLSGCLGIFEKETNEGTLTETPIFSDDQDKRAGDSELAEKIDYEMFTMLNNEILFELTNTGDEAIADLVMYADYYDENNDEVAQREYYFKAFNPGQTTYEFTSGLKELEIDVEKTKISFALAIYGRNNINLIENIEYYSETLDSNSIGTNVKNAGDQKIEFIKLHTLFYSDSEIVGSTARVATDINPGDEIQIEFLSPIDVESKIVTYDDYEVIITTAYYIDE